MTDDTLHTLQTADITQLNLPSPSPLHLAAASPRFLPPCPPHTSAYCPLHGVFSFPGVAAGARYVNEVNRIVACRGSGATFAEFPVNFALIQSAFARLPAFWLCMRVRGCRRVFVFVSTSTHSGMFSSLSYITSSLAEISHNHISRSPFLVRRRHKCGTELAASFLPSYLMPAIKSLDKDGGVSVDKDGS